MAGDIAAQASATGMEARSNSERMFDALTTTQEEIGKSPFFHRYEESSTVYETPRDWKKQREMIADASAVYAGIAQQALIGCEETAETLRMLLQAAAHAEGKQELLQVKAQLDALAAADRAQISGLSNAYNAIRYLRHKQEMDDAIEFQKTVERSRIIVADPFDEDAADAAGFQRPEAQGFVSF